MTSQLYIRCVEGEKKVGEREQKTFTERLMCF